MALNLSTMASDLILQALFISTMIFLFLWMLNIPQKFFNKIRYRDKSIYAAKRHFVLGAELLSKSRLAKSRVEAANLAKSAADHADKSISIDPKDAAAHILKALAYDAQGFSTSAVEAMDVALSPLAIKSLSDDERSDALCKRAEIKVKGSGGVDGAVADLVEAVRLKGDNAVALKLLGECYEKKEMKEEAGKAYKRWVEVEPESARAQAALERLG
ncbi:Tetratricopeptide-like helical [Artemisia annua]|uniref:Tetratricopeptide-like helical n=1 Tax=Artemisia annua TaxID=35608 RepID=A0A2U1LSH8_ARTAN|nr:Tetratricopeptide-like helical [Artemisia annua]